NANANFTEEELADLNQIFADHDKNNDGRVNTEELLMLIGSLDIQADKDDVLVAIQQFDTDGDDALGLHEFIALMAELRKLD
ncbi:hypothetical protein BG000_005378, partial [Podila horticola]